MKKLIEMIRCNRVSIALELSLQFIFAAACTVAALGLGAQIDGGPLVVYAKVLLGSSLFVFVLRLHHRCDVDSSVIESREEYNERKRAIFHDLAEMLTVWSIVGAVWFAHWLLANYILTGFIVP